MFGTSAIGSSAAAGAALASTARRASALRMSAYNAADRAQVAVPVVPVPAHVGAPAVPATAVKCGDFGIGGGRVISQVPSGLVVVLNWVGSNVSLPSRRRSSTGTPPR